MHVQIRRVLNAHARVITFNSMNEPERPRRRFKTIVLPALLCILFVLLLHWMASHFGIDYGAVLIAMFGVLTVAVIILEFRKRRRDKLDRELGRRPADDNDM